MAKNHTTVAEIHENDKNNPAYSSTYCAADDKIRIYCGRVERETYNYLRQNKFVSTPKQSCDFVAVWSPRTEDIALAMISEEDDIGDEDTSPEERAADRAERFAGYRDKRRSEAHGYADKYDAGPDAFGNQNRQRAERQAARHERSKGNALSQWSKAEYWQSRTAGVIDHALHKCDAHTRRGRILTIEADMRRATEGGRWHQHLQHRLDYENAMLAAEGGQASEVEMIIGGFVGNRQIWKINRSPVTGRVVSVAFSANGGPRNIERLGADVYRAPTPEELEAFHGKKQAAPKKPSMINPTEEDARRLQAIWNSNRSRENAPRGSVELTTQARYTRTSKFTDMTYTTTLFEDGTAAVYRGTVHEWVAAGKKIVGKMRISPSLYGVDSIIVLTDKPQKPLPIIWITPDLDEQETPEPPQPIETQEAPEPEYAQAGSASGTDFVTADAPAAGYLF